MVMTQWDIVGGEFVASAVKATQYPQDTVDEVAFIGRSNVGKSSLLNSLARRKDWLASAVLLVRPKRLISILFVPRKQRRKNRCVIPFMQWTCQGMVLPGPVRAKRTSGLLLSASIWKIPGPEACLYPYGYPSRTHGKRY